jgi:hypothetical protein
VTQRTSFAKMQRDRDKQAKAAAKRDRRQERQADAGTADPSGPLVDEADGVCTAEELLTLVERVHRQFEGGTIDFETFEETKLALLKRLPVD